jgi:tetratricopeptide (TPR) repeat protein
VAGLSDEAYPVPGSVRSICDHLSLWIAESKRGLARIVYVEENAREGVVNNLRTSLRVRGIPFSDINLPPEPLADWPDRLTARLRECPSGVVSVMGFGAAMAHDRNEFLKAIHSLNFNREIIARFPLHQIWWMPESTAEEFLRFAPDLNSWFLVRLRLTQRMHIAQGAICIPSPIIVPIVPSVCIHNLPFPPIGRFLRGRDKEIREVLSSSAPTAITQAIQGSGGIGKTRLAVELGWRAIEDGFHRAVLFVSADSRESLSANLAALADCLRIPECGIDEATIRDSVLSWLETNERWLLVLDNVNTDAAALAVRAVLPRLTRGRVLITSRRHGGWGAGVRAITLDTLDVETAARFLLDRTADRPTEPNDERNACQLATLLGGLPIALEQAAAHIAVKRMTLADYIQAWELEREEVLGWCDQRLMQYPQSVLVTYERTTRELSPPARALLNLSAFLAPEPIPLALLEQEKGADHLAGAVKLLEDASSTPSTPSALSTPSIRSIESTHIPRPRDALGDLAKFSLANRQAETYSVHRLVQEVVRLRIPEERRRAWTQAALDWVNACAPTDSGDVRTWKTWDPLRPHAEEAARRADAAGIAEPTSRLMSSLGTYLHAKGLYEQSEPLMRRALAIDENSFGPDHPNVAIRLNNLALLLGDTNRLGEAEPLMRRALDIVEHSFGPDHPDVATALNNLAQLLGDTNRLAEAEPLMRRALAIDENSFGPDHPNVAIHLNNLAQLLGATNRLTEAEPLMRRALAIDENSFGPDHPNVAIRLNNLAQLLQDTNRLAEAEPLMRRALEIFQASYGPDHPHTQTAKGNLTIIIEEMGKK